METFLIEAISYSLRAANRLRIREKLEQEWEQVASIAGEADTGKGEVRDNVEERVVAAMERGVYVSSAQGDETEVR